MWRRRTDTTTIDTDAILPVLVVGANLLTLWTLSAEVIAAADSGIVDAIGRTAFYTKNLALSLVWALYASAGILLGVIKRWRILRLASKPRLASLIVKLFLFDSFASEQGYRVAAFLSLGGLLLIGRLLYQPYNEIITGFLFEGQTPSL